MKPNAPVLQADCPVHADVTLDTLSSRLHVPVNTCDHQQRA